MKEHTREGTENWDCVYYSKESRSLLAVHNWDRKAIRCQKRQNAGLVNAVFYPEVRL